MDRALLLALMVVLFSFQSLFTRLYSKSYAGVDKSAATPVFSVCYGLFIALCSWVAGGFGFHASWQTWLFGLLNALILLLYNTSMIKSGNLGSYAFLMLSSLFGGIVIPLIAGTAFLGERMSLLKWTAAALMLAAVLLMNSKGLTLKNAARGYFFWCALLFLANGLYGTVMNFQVRNLNGQEGSEMRVILFAFSALLAFLAEALQGRGRKLIGGFAMGKKAGLWLAACCVSAFAAVRLLMYLLSKMQTGIVHTINNGGVLVLSLLYAIVLFGEKPNRLQYLGMALAAASIVMLSL